MLTSKSMLTLTHKSAFLHYYRTTAALRAGDFDPSQAWPAPAKKADALVLRKPAPISAEAFEQTGQTAELSSVAPFPAPVREDAFALPRPAVVPGASAAWAPPLRKSPAAILGSSAPVRSEVEFPQPPRFTEKLSMRHGQFCRSC